MYKIAVFYMCSNAKYVIIKLVNDMKLVEMKCKNCGSILKVDSEAKETTCSYCQTTFKIDDEILHHKIDDAEQTGYEMEKGRLRAQKEAKEEAEKEKIARQQVIYKEEQKRKNLRWWIIGWIFCFPIPLTILIWRNNKWDQKTKIIVTVALWGAILLIGALTPGETTTTNTTSKAEETPMQEKEEKENKTKLIDDFVTNFNKDDNYKLINMLEYDAHDENSGFYRTEFRLNAFEKNKSIHANVNDENTSIDIVNYELEPIIGTPSLRIYIETSDKKIMNDLFIKSAKLFCKEVSDDELSEIINKANREDTIIDERFLLDNNDVSGYIMNVKGKYTIFMDK